MKILSAMVLTSLLWTSSGIAIGQELSFRADRKITGQYYKPYTARTYQRSAINHARVLEYYGKTNTTIPKDVAQEHATEIRRNLTATTKELAKLEPEIKNDKEAQSLVVAIKAHHVKASEACGMLETECAKQQAEGVKLADCCAEMAKELKAADELHDKLMKHLKVPALEESKK